MPVGEKDPEKTFSFLKSQEVSWMKNKHPEVVYILKMNEKGDL